MSRLHNSMSFAENMLILSRKLSISNNNDNRQWMIGSEVYIYIYIYLNAGGGEKKKKK